MRMERSHPAQKCGKEAAGERQITGTKYPGGHKVTRSTLWQMSDDEECVIRGATPLGFGLLVSGEGDKLRWLHSSIEHPPASNTPQREVTGESDLSKAVSLVAHDRRIEVIESLEACPNLRTIDLSFNKIARIEGWVRQAPMHACLHGASPCSSMGACMAQRRATRHTHVASQ